MDLISIIIPVYNKEKYLLESVHSVLNQSYQNIEVILIDDGSTDKSGEICDNLAKLDTRIIVFHSENRGVSMARNTGIEMACGNYIMFFDADDYAEPEWCEKLLMSIKKEKAHLGICSVRKEEVGGKELGVHAFEDNYKSCTSNLLELLNNEFLSALWDKIFRTKIIKEYNIRFNVRTNIWEDILFNLDYLLSISQEDIQIACCKDVLYHYRSVPTGLSKKYTPWQVASEEIYKKLQFLDKKYKTDMNIAFYNKRCCDWCLSEIYYQARMNKEKSIIFRADCIKKLLLSREYQIAINSNEFQDYSSEKYRKILKSGSCLLILIYNKLAELKENGQSIKKCRLLV